jgi:hypothetical protein
MKTRLLFAAALVVTIGAAVAQEDGLAAFRDALRAASDQRNPDRVVERAFDAVLETRVAVTRSLARLIEQDVDGAREDINEALDLAITASDEFGWILETVEIEGFGTVVMPRGDGTLILMDFSQTLAFMREEITALVEALAAILDVGFSRDRLETVRRQAQALEDYTAAYFDLLPQR